MDTEMAGGPNRTLQPAEIAGFVNERHGAIATKRPDARHGLLM